MRALPRVELVVEPTSLERSDRGLVSGRIWLRDGDAAAQADFPEVGWCDLPVAVLAAWLPALYRLAAATPGSARAECRFMDGPYCFMVSADVPGIWRVRCVEERSAGAHAAAADWRTDPATFLVSVARAARAVLGHCDARAWWSADTEAIREALERGDDLLA